MAPRFQYSKQLELFFSVLFLWIFCFSCGPSERHAGIYAAVGDVSPQYAETTVELKEDG